MRSYEKARFWRDRLGGSLGRRKIILGLIGLLLIATVAGQLLYPRDRALPMARMAAKSVGGTRYDELVRQITTSFNASNVTIKTSSTSVTLPLSHTGATPEAEMMARHLIDYPLWQRLLPFSLFVVRPQVDTMEVYFSAQQLQAAAETLAGQLTAPPANARLAITDGKLVATPAKAGQTVQASAVVKALSTGRLGFQTTTLTVPSETQQPARSDSDIAPVQGAAEAAINRHITITAADGTNFSPDQSTIASWLVIGKRPDGQLELKVDETSVAAYVAGLNDKVKVNPGVTHVQLVDGVETGRSDGASGQAIVVSELASGLEQAVLDGTAPRHLVMHMVPVPPVVTYARSYTSSQKGLQAYVDYITQSEDIRIALAQVDGNGWSASGRATEQLPSASTYKLYVSYMLFNQINANKLGWGDSMLDTDVSGCFERMIVVSDNACAEQFIAMFGAANINSYLYVNGISHATTFVSSIATQTSAADLEKMLLGIQNGTMISGSDRSMLLDKMGRQVYRAGVPAGSAGTVQDKVGFLWDYLHDAAIVHHPKGTYVLAIMTKGSSWGRIAEITTQLEHIMYP